MHDGRLAGQPRTHDDDGAAIESAQQFVELPHLGVAADGAHAFYLGTELMKAEIAWRLGKRYAQDEPLNWGSAVDVPEDDKTRLRAVGHTLRPAEG